MSFAIHLGKYVGGELVGPEPSLTSGQYVGGVDLRVVCHWNQSTCGQHALRFKIKKKARNNGSCTTWNGSEIRNIEDLPFGLQWLLKQTLHHSSPHLVADIPNNILQFVI